MKCWWLGTFLLLLPCAFPVPLLDAAIQLKIEQGTCSAEIGDQVVTIEAEGNSIKVLNHLAPLNCCYVADARLSIEGSLLSIQEKAAFVPDCACSCLFDIAYTVSRLSPGKYDVLLFREDGDLLAAGSVQVAEAPASQSACTGNADVPEEFEATAGQDSIVLEHRNAKVECCLQFKAQAAVSGQAIAIQEMDMSPAPCFCICNFDLQVVIPGLPPGIYHLSLLDFEGKLAFEADVEVKGPRMIATQARRADSQVPPPAREVAIRAEGTEVIAEIENTVEDCCLDLQATCDIEPGNLYSGPGSLTIRALHVGPYCDCRPQLYDLRLEVLDLDQGPYDVTLFGTGGESLAKEEVRIQGDRKFIRGAASGGDGDVDISDAIGILFYLFAGEAMECLDAADVNDNGEIGIEDPVYLLRFLFLDGSPPKEPFPALGPDPTPDTIGC